MILGTFGKLTWFRCRNCGIDYSVKVENVRIWNWRCPDCSAPTDYEPSTEESDDPDDDGAPDCYLIDS